MTDSVSIEKMPDMRRRAFWLKHLHQWHWISSGLCLVGMLLFSVTGITLNHAAQIQAKPEVITRTAQLPDALLNALLAESDEAAPALPAEVDLWLAENLSIRPGEQAPEWSEDEIYLGLPQPGGDAWMTIDLGTGDIVYEVTDRGWISYFNDLHKGRHTGTAWSWFIDLFAVASLVFCVTGLFLLQMHARQRPATWPVVGFGLASMLVLMILFVH